MSDTLHLPLYIKEEIERESKMGHLFWVSAERKRAAWKRGRGFSPLFFIPLSREKEKGKITCDLVHLLLYRNSYMWFLVIVLEVNGEGKRKGRKGTREKGRGKGAMGKGIVQEVSV